MTDKRCAVESSEISKEKTVCCVVPGMGII